VSFTVDKWYLDLVTDDGTALVAYVVDVGWHGVAMRLASRLIVDAAGRRDEHSTRQETAWPALAAGRLSWASEALGLHGEWLALAPPVARTLVSSPAGVIDWTCDMPRARATVIAAGSRYEGLGYAEHLHLTLPPWALPFSTLRWGRHVSDRHAVVWIERDGADCRRDIWIDGAPSPEARVVADGVCALPGDRALRWQPGRDLVRRSVGDALARVAPTLAQTLSGRLATMREHKQLSRSSLVDASGRALDAGWAIHEVVTW
jgi:hypothetical protein